MSADDRPFCCNCECVRRRRFEELASIRDDDAGIAEWSSCGLDVRFRYLHREWQERVLMVHCASTSAAAREPVHDSFLARRARHRGRLLPNGGREGNVARWDTTPLGGRRCNVSAIRAGRVRMGFMLRHYAVSVGFRSRHLASRLRAGGEVWLDALNGHCIASVLLRFSCWLRRRPRYFAMNHQARSGRQWCRQDCQICTRRGARACHTA